MRDAHTIIVSLLVSAVVSVGAITLFWATFHMRTPVGVCEKYDQRLEGTGPYQHKHCYDPKTRLMYLPPEIEP